MPVRTLALATGLAALAATAPALANPADHNTIGSLEVNVTGLGTAGDVTVVRNMDHRRADGPNVVAMVITKGDISTNQGGYKTEIERSDTWKPGYVKSDQGDYYMIKPQTGGDAANPGKMQIVRSDTWQPGYLKTDEGDYYMMVPERNTPRPDGDMAVVVDPGWSSAMQVYTLDGGQADRGSDLFIERTDTWQPGFSKSDDGDYYRMVHLADSVPASELPDF